MKKKPVVLVLGFSEYAKIENGSFYLSASHITFWVKAIPANLKSRFLACRFIFDKDDYGKHELAFKVLNPSGEMIFENESLVSIDLKPEEGEFISFGFCLDYPALPINAYGGYKLIISCDGNIVMSMPFEVRISKS